MSNVTAQDVAKLRQMSGAGLMDAKRALEEASGDFDKASELLRKKGQTNAAKKSQRDTLQGLVESYVHPGGRIGVLLEVNCETDFVARNEKFVTLVKDLALHIAAANPLYLSKDDIPGEVIAKEREILLSQAESEDKPEAIREKMVEGRLKNFFTEACLLDQDFVKDPSKSVGELLQEAISSTGENIRVRRFTRYELAG
jgi:elongation factor Ts